MDKKSMFAIVLTIVVSAAIPHAATVSEDQFLTQALEDHPDIAAAESQIRFEAGAGRQAGTLANPELILEREDPDHSTRQDTLKMSWQLPFDGRKHRISAAEAEEAAARANLETTSLAARREMQSLFATWFVETARSDVYSWALTRAEDLASRLRARAEAGEASGVEARRLGLEVEILRRNAGAARAGERAARSAASAWSPMVTDRAEPVQPPLSAPPAAPTLADHPQIRALAQKVEAAHAEHQFHRRQVEAPTVSVGWLKIEEERRSLDGPVLGLSWPVPIFGRNKGNRQMAEATLDRAQSELESAKRRIRENFQSASAAYEELYNTNSGGGVDCDDGLVIDAVFSAFEAGEADLTDVLDSLRTIVEVRLARLNTLADTLAAERELEAALGRPLPQGGTP